MEKAALVTSSEIFMSEIGRITQIVENFLHSGVAYVPELPKEAAFNAGYMLRLMKTISKEKKRTFIHAQHTRSWNGYDYIELRIPRQERLQSVTSSLRIVAMPVGQYPARDDPPVARPPAKATIETFRFRGSEGFEIFSHWLEQCRTDPVFRVALKL